MVEGCNVLIDVVYCAVVIEGCNKSCDVVEKKAKLRLQADIAYVCTLFFGDYLFIIAVLYLEICKAD